MSNSIWNSRHFLKDEDADNRTERTHGDVEGRKKYSHVDLIHMIGGMDAERGTVTAGNRGYYLMVRFFGILGVDFMIMIHEYMINPVIPSIFTWAQCIPAMAY